jgi:hypothetical protein
MDEIVDGDEMMGDIEVLVAACGATVDTVADPEFRTKII